MGARRSTPSSARERYYKRRVKRTGLLILVALLLAVVVCSALVYPVLAPDVGVEVSQFDTPTPIVTLPATQTAQSTPTATATVEPDLTKTLAALPTQGQIVPPSEDSQILYYTIAGDSLDVVSLHFGVEMNEITSPDELDHEGLLPPGQLLIIPNRIGETSSSSKLLPDSEVTFSPSTVDFDIQAFVDQAGGYLSTYTEYLASTGWTSGADIIGRVALEYSVNPRLLLAFLEYKSGWVYGTPETEFDTVYPMGYANSLKEDLYLQCAWFASTVMDGYYGWREGRTLVVDYLDGQIVRLAPELNAGTVGLMHAFAKLYDFDEWAYRLYGDNNFFTLFETMFGSPWIRAQAVEPLIPADTLQPEMILPFDIGRLWAFSGGPHAAWSAADVWAALDFAPASAESGCHESNAWVVASMPGLIVRSGNGVVVIDMDGDGYEQTGWTLLYLHIATKDRIEEGTWVEVGDRLGHPSCEGGRATGTHVHMARRYNGEWVPADGPLPFTLSGWVARAANIAYEGWLIRDGEYIYANTAGTIETQITREE
ncbi:MAG: M23 family metallopeptidase [Anaerolineaceae bacterium]|nr:M23 family metallopeptidase [Anaerolineaceae bacterium]